MDVMALVMEMLMTTMTATETVHSVVHYNETEKLLTCFEKMFKSPGPIRS